MLCGGIEGIEGVAENISPVIGTHQWSCALSILLAFVLQHALFAMPKKTRLESNPSPLGKQELAQLPSK